MRIAIEVPTDRKRTRTEAKGGGNKQAQMKVLLQIDQTGYFSKEELAQMETSGDYRPAFNKLQEVVKESEDYIWLDYNTEHNYFWEGWTNPKSPLYEDWHMISECISLEDSAKFQDHVKRKGLQGMEVINEYAFWRYSNRKI